MSYFYESGAVSVTWTTNVGSVDLSKGWGEGTFLNITPSAARIEHSAGADGTYTYSKIADKGCTIEMTFKDVAPVNKEISAISAKQDVIGAAVPFGVFTVVDNTGDSIHFATQEAVLSAIPTISFDRVSGERTWTWICESFIMTDDVSVVTSAINEYIRQSTNLINV
jgi:hypothetical protein